MSTKGDLHAGIFSLIIPGTGQLMQGRTLVGGAFLTWAVLATIGYFVATDAGVPWYLLMPELVLVTVWSVVNAYRWPLRDQDGAAK